VTLWVVGLFLMGLVLLLIEFFLPGGVLGVIGGLMIIGSCALGVMHFPEYAVPLVAGEIVATIFILIIGLSMVRHSPIGRKLTLAKSQTIEDGYVNVPNDDTLIGIEGEVYTPLRPVGTVILRGERVQAVTFGTYVPKGAVVRVIEVHGNRIVVEQVAAQEKT
jgi:membrane-bound serine protease (ClpP class)